jgi:ubiquinone/menaquinone biosynthesis C-methylase UbiE
LADVRSHLDADYQPKRCVEFGCGVGRIVIRLAGLPEKLICVNVSDHMLAEAVSNFGNKNVENVSFVKSDDQ